MPIDYSGGSLKEFGPKVGESKVIHIRESVKVEEPNSEDNFRSQVKNFGYRFELTLTNGRIFMLNVWKLFFAFKEPVNAEVDEKGNKVPVQDGDKVQIDHIGNSEYKVTILEKGTGIGLVVEDTEKIAYDQAKQNGTTVAPTTQTPAAQAPVPAAQPAPVATQAVQTAPVTTPPAATPPVATPPVQAAPDVAKPAADVDLPF